MDFSEIALAKLLQLFPELSNYILTFKDITEDLNRGEDESLRIGIFILTFANKAYYLPVVSKNDVIQPLDSIFCADDQSFLPLTKSYVETLVNSQSESFGSRRKIPSSVTQNPSVYNLVVPPRTGKFVYAGTSRFVEFLAATPGHVKKAFAEVLRSNMDFARGLGKYFDIADVVRALKHVSAPSTASKAPALNFEQIEILSEKSPGMTEEEIQDILNKGYALRGIQKETRVAVPAYSAEDFANLSERTGSDSGNEFSFVTSEGELRTGFIPKTMALFQKAALLERTCSGKFFILFGNGDYAFANKAISKGGPVNNPGQIPVIDLAHSTSGVESISAILKDDLVAIFDKDNSLVGVFQVSSVAGSSAGTTLKVFDELRGESRQIVASKSLSVISSPDRKNLFLPDNLKVVVLNDKYSGGMETDIFLANSKLELGSLKMLGDMERGAIAYDGVGYGYNGKIVGSKPNLMKVLVVKEGLDPNVAENFIKQAEEKRLYKFYMSKKAEFDGGEIPSYGEYAPPIDESEIFGSKAQQNVSDAMVTGDSSTIESTVLSELLQAQGMEDYLNEYLPDIKLSIDRLGRILLLARLNMSEMFKGDNASEIFSFLASLRNVYRTLGDNYVKLERLAGTLNGASTGISKQQV